MYTKNTRNRWTMFLFLAAGMVLGAFLAYYLKRYAFGEWLDYGLPFGMTSPMTLSFGIGSITLGIMLRVNIGSVIGLVLGFVAYKLANRA